jgi:hypothetical protein
MIRPQITHRNRIFHLALLSLIFGIGLLPSLAGSDANAQTGGIQWSPPINLSNSFSSSTYPFPVSDPYGNVHVFWAEDLGGEAVNPAQPFEKSNSIFYSQWNGTTWSEPIDLFFTIDGGGYNYPSATLDPSGRLHLAWQGYAGIFYSSVPLQEVGSVKAWAPVQSIAFFRGDGPHLFAGSNGVLHIVYAAWQNANSNLRDGNIYYQSSSDGGKSWSLPYRISEILPNVEKQASYPSILVDQDQTIHIVWYQAEPPGWNGSSIHYARSEDGGESWKIPVEMSRRSGNDTWTSKPELAMTANGEMHLTWVCGEYAFRCHRWSIDGGETWFPTRRQFGNMLALAGNDTLVQDNRGTLYWILQLRYPSALYYSTWTGTSWSGLQTVNDGYLNDGHHVRAVSSLGNQIYLIIVDQTMKEIWYMRGTTEASPLQPAPTPYSEFASIAVQTPVTEPTPSPVPTPLLDPSLQSMSVDLESQSNFLNISLLSVAGILFLTALARRWMAGKD